MKLNTKSKMLLVVPAIALLLLPFLTDALFGRGWVRIVDFAMLYIMLALGLNIVVGYAGLLDLGYIAFFAVGAYCYALTGSPHLAQAFPVALSDGVHLPFWIVLPMAALIAGGFGLLLGAPTLRLRGDYLAIVTLGFGEIIRIFLNNLNAPVNLTNGPQGISRIDPVSIANVQLNTTQNIFGIEFPPVHLYFYLFLAFTALVIFVSQRLERSRIGRAWMAIREDEIAASAMGINTRNLKLLAFAMGATFGGASGALFAGFQGFVSPESFSLMESIMVLCNIRAQGSFDGRNVESRDTTPSAAEVYDSVSGTFEWASPRLRLPQVVMKSGADTYVGSAELEDNGQFTVKVSDGTKHTQVAVQ